VTAATHVALIRGINVGGNNTVPMAGLREALGVAGVPQVRTYIQSGNVVLTCPQLSTADVNALVERVLRESFGVHTVVVTVTAEALGAVVAGAPTGFGVDSQTWKHDVVFVRPGRDLDALLAKVRLREGVDEAWRGPGVLYFRRVSALVTRSYMREIIAMPEYQDMTIRNWRTTTAVAAMAGTSTP